MNCSVEGCLRPALVFKVQLCRAHYARNWHHGETGGPEIRPHKPEGHIGYSRARRTLNEIRGFAKEHLCLECPKTAMRWTLISEATVYRETTGQYAGLPYSDNPWHYEPRCTRHATWHNDEHGFGRGQV